MCVHSKKADQLTVIYNYLLYAILIEQSSIDVVPPNRTTLAMPLQKSTYSVPGWLPILNLYSNIPAMH